MDYIQSIRNRGGPQMTIEIRQTPGRYSRNSRVVMTQCPLCGEDLPEGIGFSEHWTGESGAVRCTANDKDVWDPSPALLREGENTDDTTHARRNLEQLRMADGAE